VLNVTEIEVSVMIENIKYNKKNHYW